MKTQLKTVPLPPRLENFLRGVSQQILLEHSHVEAIEFFTPYQGVPHAESDSIATLIMGKHIMGGWYEAELWPEPDFDHDTFAAGRKLEVDVRVTLRNQKELWASCAEREGVAA